MVLSPEILQTQQVLYAENVTALRHTIALKYPDASSKERADLFAKAIKHILHTNLSSFEENIQKALIHELLKNAVQKQDFAINAQDVITSYAALSNSQETELAPLTTWLSETMGETLSAEEVITNFPYLRSLNSTTLVPTSISSMSDAPNIVDSSTLSEPDLSSNISNLALTKSLILPLPATGFPYKKAIFIGSTFCIVTCAILLAINIKPQPTEIPIEVPLSITTTETTPTFLIPEEDYLMAHLQYKVVDELALKEWLIGRDSLLAEDPYFSTILEAAASYNINPLLMFAITGQEQGFVPKTHKRALEIANNPFNVYGSWQDFNTDIKDTSFIAARTIINLSKGCPSDADPIKWLNQKYAEDPNWHKGVTALLKQLEEVADKKT